MSSAEGPHECEECETSYASEEELDKESHVEFHDSDWTMININRGDLARQRAAGHEAEWIRMSKSSPIL